MDDTTTDHDDERDQSEDKPSLRQRLHSATGDRDAEAKALADRAGVDADAARTAVNRAHGESIEDAHTANEEASPEDAREAEQERSN